MKSIYALLTLACLFTFASTTNLEARHHTHFVTRSYYAPTPQYVVQYYPQQVFVQQPVYVQQPVFVQQPVQTVVYQQPVCRRVFVRERCNPAAGLITSFALGLGLGLLR